MSKEKNKIGRFYKEFTLGGLKLRLERAQTNAGVAPVYTFMAYDGNMFGCRDHYPLEKAFSVGFHVVIRQDGGRVFVTLEEAQDFAKGWMFATVFPPKEETATMLLKALDAAEWHPWQ